MPTSDFGTMDSACHELPRSVSLPPPEYSLTTSGHAQTSGKDTSVRSHVNERMVVIGGGR